MTTDQELITRILEGEHQAFTELVQRYEELVFNLAYRMLRDTFEAEDAAQEAFLRAYRALQRYDPNRSFKTWLLSITSNHCIDRLRRQRLQKLSLDDLLPTHPALASKEPGPEARTVKQEQTDAVQDMLGRLSPDYQAVIVLHYWYDMSCAEIAEVLRTKEGTVKSRLFRARQTLAGQMAGPEMPQLALAFDGI